MENTQSNLDSLGKPHGICLCDGKQFPEADFVIPLIGNAYRASEGIIDGDYAVVSLKRQPVPGNLVIADTPRDGRRLMRLIEAVSPFLRSDNPGIGDVSLNEEGVRIIGVVLGTLRNPVLGPNEEADRPETIGQ
jgi:SOS-response transcriptional repressor LexA